MKTDRNNDERIRAMVADLCNQDLPEPRKAALMKCTDRTPFAFDRYVACMTQEGETP